MAKQVEEQKVWVNYTRQTNDDIVVYINGKKYQVPVNKDVEIYKFVKDVIDESLKAEREVSRNPKDQTISEELYGEVRSFENDH